MKSIKLLILIGWACLATFSLQAQKKVSHSFQYQGEAKVEGELKEITQVSYSGTKSIRLYFDQVQLGPNSYLLLEGSDGAQQKMDAQAVENWGNSSAYFNGQNVKVSLYQAKGEEVSLKIKNLKVDKQGKSTKTSSNTPPMTARVRNSKPYSLPPWAAAVGRFTDGETAKGTGWIAANGAIVTDVNFGDIDDIEVNSGNYLEEYDIIEFNVPPSNPDGTVNHPAPEDQYPLNKNYHFWRRIEGRKESSGMGFIRIEGYELFNGNLVVGGYTIIEALPNSTGQRPGERIGEYFQVLRHGTGPEIYDLEMEIFHYSRSGAEMSSQTLRRNTVALRNQQLWLSRVSDKNRFLVYDTPTVHPGFWDRDMDGAPIVYPGSNIAVGIHSEGSPWGRSPSLGTGFRDQDFRKHLGEFFTTAMTYVDQASVVGAGNGNIYKPYLTIAEGAQQAAEDDILNIARGSYNESVTIDKPLKLSAPVGAVVIGAAGGANARSIQPTIPAALYSDDPSTVFAEEDLLVEPSSLKSFPNPFVEQTELHYTLIEDSPVLVKVYDILGQEVHTLMQEEQYEGEHSVQWDGRNYQGRSMPTGLYIMQLKTGGETSAVRVMKQ